MRKTHLWALTGALAAVAAVSWALRDDWAATPAPIRPPAAPPAPLPPPPPEVPPRLTVDQAISFISPSEGLRLRAYKDTRRVPTIGYGFNLRRGGLARARLAALGLDYQAVRAGKVPLTAEQAYQLLAWDVTDAITTAVRIVGTEFWQHPVPVQAAVVDLIYNLGPSGFYEFQGARAALARGDYRTVAGELLKAPWARQVGPERVRKVINALLAGPQGMIS